MTQFERDTRVGRLRIRAAAGDALALTMRGEAALRPLDLRPPGMPRRAILCIRRMDDPLPRAIDLRTAHPPRPTEWERAARSVIAEAFRRAVRVRDGFVPADAGVVMFDDRAVLLAAAARDAVRGRLDQWYWKKLLRSATLEAVLHEWQRDVTYISAAIELLANDAVTFIRFIEPARAAMLAAALVGTTQPPKLPPLWRAIAPEAAHAALNDEQRTLMAIALILRRAPDVLRADHAPQQTLQKTRRRPADLPKKRERSPQHQVASLSEPPEEPGSNSAVTPREPGTPAIAPQPTPRAAVAKRGNGVIGRGNPAARQSLKSTDSEPSAIDCQPASHVQPETSDPQPVTAQPIDSTHAGAFFLLNLVDWKYLRLTARLLAPSIENDDVWTLMRVVRRRRDPGRKPALRDILRALQTFAGVRAALAKRKIAPGLLIRQRGGIVTTPAHLDVTFSLERHPIEIRMAGLDRDPGWIAAIGRHVAFHFD